MSEKKLLWIRWAGGIETRDDGYKIYPYGPTRYLLVKYIDGLEMVREICGTREEAHRVADSKEK